MMKHLNSQILYNLEWQMVAITDSFELIAYCTLFSTSDKHVQSDMLRCKLMNSDFSETKFQLIF